MPPSPLRRASGSHAVYSELRRRILALELEPGERLNETRLTASFGVSRTPFREAVRLLLAEGLLEQLPTGGVVVRDISTRDVEELYAVRAVLEGLQAREAAARAGEADLTALEGLVERNARLVDLPDDAMHAGQEFHALIARIADNAWAQRVHDQTGVQMARYRVFTNESDERRHAALAEHRDILAALQAGDAERARNLAERHVLTARDIAVAAVLARLGR